MLLYVFFVLTTAKTNTRANYTLLPAGLSTTQIVMGVLEELKKEDMVSLDDLLAPIFVSYLSFLLAIYIYIVFVSWNLHMCIVARIPLMHVRCRLFNMSGARCVFTASTSNAATSSGHS